jgi:hypothetical protein
MSALERAADRWGSAEVVPSHAPVPSPSLGGVICYQEPGDLITFDRPQPGIFQQVEYRGSGIAWDPTAAARTFLSTLGLDASALAPTVPPDPSATSPADSSAASPSSRRLWSGGTLPPEDPAC